jgi:uncharacterized protein (TIGR02271 family)
MPLTIQEMERIEGAPLLATDGEKIGTIEDVYYDRETGRPEWALVNRGFLGLQNSLVPLAGANTADGGVSVRFTKDRVKSAPDIKADGDLSEAEEERLYDHYGVGIATAPTADVDVDTADDDVVVSEEVADVGTVRRPRELVRLKKDVRTETVTKKVPVQKEEIRVEREPVRGDVSPAELDDDEAVMTAGEEVPVVNKHVEPRERVRLEKDVATDERKVKADVRREDVKVDRDKA